MKFRKIFLTVTLLTYLSAGIFAQSLVKDVVYEDLNRNNKKDRTEKGVPNVAVSNLIDEGEWKPMQRVNEFDPTYLHLLHECDFSGLLSNVNPF